MSHQKRFSILMRITPGILVHFKIDESFKMVFFCLFENFALLNLEWGADLGRSRLVDAYGSFGKETSASNFSYSII